MKIKFLKDDNIIQTKFVDDNSELKDFDYVTFVNKLYEGENIEPLFESIEDDDKKKLESFIKEIEEIRKIYINPQKQS